jgi:hypothetical protein
VARRYFPEVLLAGKGRIPSAAHGVSALIVRHLITGNVYTVHAVAIRDTVVLAWLPNRAMAWVANRIILAVKACAGRDFDVTTCASLSDTGVHKARAEAREEEAGLAEGGHVELYEAIGFGAISIILEILGK